MTEVTDRVCVQTAEHCCKTFPKELRECVCVCARESKKQQHHTLNSKIVSEFLIFGKRR